MFNNDLLYTTMLDQTLESEKWAQISTLKMFNEKVDEIVPGYRYHVRFKSNAIDFVLRIELCNLFPERKPLVFVQPSAVHGWIEAGSGQVCNAPGLLNFTKHSDLGRVVQVIIREFTKTGLLPIRQPAPAPSLTPATSTAASSAETRTTTASNSQQRPLADSASSIKPVIQNLMDLELEPICDKQAKSELYPELNKMSTLELQIFSQNSSEQFQKFLDDNNYSQMITNRTKELRKLVTEIATETLARKPELDQLKEDVAQRTDRIINAIGRVTELRTGLDTMMDEYKPSNLCLLVENQSKADDKQSEKFASDFVDGRLEHTTEQFINEYIRLRKRHFVNKIKAENFRKREELTKKS